VWQRPQHLISRLARGRPTWFVEEPHSGHAAAPRLHLEEVGPTLTRVFLEVPGSAGRLNFGDERAAAYGGHLASLVEGLQEPVAWLYSPMALELAEALRPSLLVYDVMDDLAAFKDAPPAMKLRQHQTVAAADLIFTGGRSLHASIGSRRPDRVHLFPSGVEPQHYAAARQHRTRRERPVAGYVGVVDERLDLDLVADLARALEEWEIWMVGPVTKLDPASLPRLPNLVYVGKQPYHLLPRFMAALDVALMPFTLDETTRSISPTKTLEYLAAGLPVVSTRVPDVVADYGDLVTLADDSIDFAAACRELARTSYAPAPAGIEEVLSRQDWGGIASRMAALVERALESGSPSVLAGA
jgi:glycosyltransferase involved in cell wall biosynthesis